MEGRTTNGIRFFVTGRPTSFTDIESTLDIRLSAVEIGDRNREDILKSIDMRMDNMETLKKTVIAVFKT